MAHTKTIRDGKTIHPSHLTIAWRIQYGPTNCFVFCKIVMVPLQTWNQRWQQHVQICQMLEIPQAVGNGTAEAVVAEMSAMAAQQGGRWGQSELEQKVIVSVRRNHFSLISLTVRYNICLNTTLHTASCSTFSSSTAIILSFSLIWGDHHTYNVIRFCALPRLSGMVPLRQLLSRYLRWWHQEGLYQDSCWVCLLKYRYALKKSKPEQNEKASLSTDNNFPKFQFI